MASETKFDLANVQWLYLGQNPLPTTFRMVAWEYWPCLNSLAGTEKKVVRCRPVSVPLSVPGRFGSKFLVLLVLYGS